MDLSFLDNPIFKTLVLGKIKKVFKEHGVTIITVTQDETGELKFDYSTEPATVLPTKDYNELLKLATQ